MDQTELLKQLIRLGFVSGKVTENDWKKAAELSKWIEKWFIES